MNFSAAVPNAVVMECSVHDGLDIVTQKTEVLHHLSTRLRRHPKRPQKIAVSTGSIIFDQLQSWYFGMEFAFLLTFCIGMPDRPSFQEDSTPRREYLLGHLVWDTIKLNYVSTCGRSVNSRVALRLCVMEFCV